MSALLAPAAFPKVRPASTSAQVQGVNWPLRNDVDEVRLEALSTETKSTITANSAITAGFSVASGGAACAKPTGSAKRPLSTLIRPHRASGGPELR